jgi:hypothetical protein
MLPPYLHMGLLTVIIDVGGITRLTGLRKLTAQTNGGPEGGVAPSFSR